MATLFSIIFSRTKTVFSDLDDQGSGPDPGTGCRVRVKIVDGASTGVHAVQGVLGGTIGGLADWLVKLAVHHAGKGVGLIDDAGEGIGKRGVLDSVQHHRAYGHLALIGLAPGLGGNEPGQQAQVS